MRFAALRRSDLADDLSTLPVRSTLVTLTHGTTQFGPPKSRAGQRTVSIPGSIRDDIRLHLRDYVADEPAALIFTGAKGALLGRSGFQTQSRWTASIAQAGLPGGFHFHDLRHTGNPLAAGTGASLADLMGRMGHGSARAAIYKHAIQQRDTMIADALSLSIEVERDRARNGHEPGEKA